MSHLRERKEKICLNCKSVIYGRFCHLCGQENTEPKESFWGLITHFVYDITHFDGKFFDTTRYLLFRPGYLALEYLRGRRASYLNPVRMYIFTSAFFFILFFGFIRDMPTNQAVVAEQRAGLMKEKGELENALVRESDPGKKKALEKKLNKVKQKIAVVGQTGIFKISEEDTGVDQGPPFKDSEYPKTVRAYDSAQRSLSPEKRDNWIQRFGKRKFISINERYPNNGKSFWIKLRDKFYHSIPQMMFVSLPLVALLLRLLYMRRKQYYYVNHIIFTVNLYIAVYILLLVSYGLEALYNWTNIDLFSWLAGLTYIAVFYYVYKAMRNFYQQRRAKTLLKFFLFLLAFFFLISFLLVIYFLTSALQI
jgi:hypothetical protein